MGPNEITYYSKLIETRFETFIKRNGIFMSAKNRETCVSIANYFNKISDRMSTFPLSFCHGDVKSPNIFYRDQVGGATTPVFLDWQYIHLNKGVSDVAFLLVESITFDPTMVGIVVDYYYKLWAQKRKS